MNDVLKGFIKAAIILSISYFLFYLISYRLWEKKDFDDVNYIEEDIINTNHSDTTNIDIEEIGKELYGKINFEFLENNYGSSFFNQYYGQSSIYAKDFNSDFLIYVAIVNLLKENFSSKCNGTNLIPANYVIDEVYKLFGSFVDNKSINIDGLNIIYDENNNIYLVENTKCSGNLNKYNGYIKTELYKVERKLDSIYVYEFVYFYNVDKESKLENYYAGLDIDSDILSHNYASFDRLKTSIYTFIFDKDYKMIKIEKVFK